MRNTILLLSAILLAACSPRLIPLPDPSPVAPSPAAPAVGLTPTRETNRMLALAIADLSGRLSVDPAQIHLVSVESASWTDSSLGCPLPGQAYAQAIVPGYLIRLQVSGQDYIYHTDLDKTVVLCSEDRFPVFPVTPGSIDDGQPWMPVE